jgi:hypothetical protein
MAAGRMGVKEWLIPQERQFFDLLQQVAATVEEGRRPSKISWRTSGTSMRSRNT